MKCKRCGKDGAVKCQATFSNILLALGYYCSSECFREDVNIGTECHKAYGIKKHAFGECHCGAVDPTVSI
jgi:hypothetical protein